MIFKTVSLAIVSALLLAGPSWQQVDKTKIPRESGHGVVLKVVERIDASGIFRQDNNFVHRVAWYQTNDGEAPWTYTKPNYYGGIWTVDEVNFDKTKSRSLRKFHLGILNTWGIVWDDIQWRDLEIPFYCGLAARLYIETLPGDIPPTLEEQADYFMKYYDYDGEKGKTEHFINKNEGHENKFRCVARRDLCFILDSSASVGSKNHNKTLDFIWEIVRSMPLGLKETHISQVTYSENPVLSYAYIYNNNTAESIIKNYVPYIGGGTNTGRAINFAIDKVYYGYFGKNISGILPVFMVLTAGISQDSVTKPAQNVSELGITSIAVGIGSSVKVSELEQIANHQLENVFETSFEHLNAILKRLEDSTCSAPANFYYDREAVEFDLGPTQSTYAKVGLPNEGITVSVDVSQGNVTGYVSYTEKTPNSAIYDAVVTPGHPKFFRPRVVSRQPSQCENGILYIGVGSGESDKNVFSLKILSGDHSSGDLNALLL